MFKPGDEVVCVDAIGAPELRKGCVYTFAGYHPLSYGALVVEAQPSQPYVAFKTHRFRKVQKRSTETGMAILKKIADNPNIKIKEDA